MSSPCCPSPSLNYSTTLRKKPWYCNRTQWNGVIQLKSLVWFEVYCNLLRSQFNTKPLSSILRHRIPVHSPQPLSLNRNIVHVRSEGFLKRGDETSKSGEKCKMGREVKWRLSEVKWSEVKCSEVQWSEVKWWSLVKRLHYHWFKVT
jgi:hypothetical protein